MKDFTPLDAAVIRDALALLHTTLTANSTFLHAALSAPPTQAERASISLPYREMLTNKNAIAHALEHATERREVAAWWLEVFDDIARKEYPL